MSETLETQPAKAPAPAAGAAPTFVNFQILRIDPRYHTLLSNEKVVAKQEFLSCYDTFQRQMKLAAYGLTGLSASGDLLIWRVSPDLALFNQMTGRLQGAGLGKYLTLPLPRCSRRAGSVPIPVPAGRAELFRRLRPQLSRRGAAPVRADTRGPPACDRVRGPR